MLCHPSAALHYQLNFTFSLQKGLAALTISVHPVWILLLQLLPFPFLGYKQICYLIQVSQILIWFCWEIPFAPNLDYIYTLCVVSSQQLLIQESVFHHISWQLSLWWRVCSKSFENPNMYTSNMLSLFLHINVSFIWQNISHLMWTLQGFLWVCLGSEACYLQINTREDLYMSIYWTSLSQLTPADFEFR